jgi:nucleotide-binding universal stress UspA family protein
MAIKRVLLPIHDDGSFEPLASMAFLLGEMFSAQVEGLFVQSEALLVPMFEGPISAEEEFFTVGALQGKRRAIAARADSVFKASANRFPHVEAKFHSLIGDLATVLISHGRLADISVICSQHKFGRAFWTDVQNATLFLSGRPVLLVSSSPRKSHFKKVVIAWKESLEAARAIAAAQPLLAKAEEVHLITVDDGSGAVNSLREVGEYLLLHNGGVSSKVLPDGSQFAGAQLLEYAQGLDALLVMGAFTHRRFKEAILGGVTDYVLRNATVPVLMMH